MKRQSEIDHSTLNWVNRELDATLRQSAEALQQFSEDTDDHTQLQFCVTHLHQVRGILQMLELQGAVMLTEEMEALGEALLGGDAGNRDQAAESLMRGILRLRDYLERLAGGQADAALLILPLVNDLRAAAGRPIIAESTLFAPDLESPAPADRYERDGSDRVPQVAPRARGEYQRGLLGLLRGRQLKTSLSRMVAALDALDKASPDEVSGRPWWIAAGLAEAVRDGSLDDFGAAVRHLLGQIERHIKRGPEAGAAARLPNELIRGMLYYVARAAPTTPRVEQLHEVYSLPELMSDTHRIEQAREGLFGPGAEAFRSVAEAIREDLAAVKDTLDLHGRGSRQEPEALVNAASAMRRIADTLGVLGLAEPRRVVREQADIVGELDPARGSGVAVEKAAEALLYVESTLADLTETGTVDADAAPADALFASEYRQVLGTTVNEAITEVGRIKEALVQFLESHDPAQLEGLNAHFDAVRGALAVTGMSRAAALVAAADHYVGDELLIRGNVPEPEALDDLADAITSIEYYLEAVRDGRSGADQVLDVAANSLRRLGAPVDEHAETPPPPEAGDAAVEADSEPAAPASANEAPAEESPGQGAPAADDGAAAEQSGTDFSRKRGRVNLEVPVRAEELDDEIVEIFVEEADEVLDTLRSLVPRWRDNPDDQEALLTIRRMFHTLKGSGRLAGALLLGELAWSVENLLNRVLDRTLEPDPQIPEIVAEAMAVIPELVAELRDGTPPVSDVRALMRRAASLSDPAQAEEPSGDAATAPATEGAADQAPEAGDAPAADGDPAAAETPGTVAASEPDVEPEPGPAMDPTLYEIFSRETLDHLDNVIAFLDECTETGVCRANEDLVRSLHTLTGSARMADVQPIARLGRALEQLARARQNAHRHLDAEDQDCLRRGGAIIREVVDALGREGTALPDVDALVDETVQRREGTPAPSLEALAWPPGVGEAPEFERPAGMGEPVPDAAAVASEEPPPAAPVTALPDPAWAERPPALGEALVPRWVEPAPPVPETDAAATQRPDAGIDWPAGRDEPLPAGAHRAPAVTSPSLAPVGHSAPVPPPADYPIAQPDPLAAARPDRSAAAPGTPESAGQSTDAPQPPTRPTPAAPPPDQDADLTDIFLEEARDILGFIDETVDRWEDAPEHGRDSRELHRSLHTLKGGARLAGFESIGRFCHGLESLVADVSENRISADDAFFEGVRDGLDELRRLVEAATDHAAPEPDDRVVARIAELRGGDAATPEPAGEAAAPADEELLEVFLEEAAEILGQSETLMHAWREEPGASQYVNDLQRALHTLKGGARMAGLQPIADLSHALETLLRRAGQGELAPGEALFDLLENANDRLIRMRDGAEAGRPLEPVDDLLAAIAAAESGEVATAATAASAANAAPAPEPAPPAVAETPAAPVAADAARAAAEEAHRQSDVVRVRADLLDDLVNYAGEVSIYRARLEQQAGAVNFNLDELGQTVSRLREQLRSLEIETEAQILNRFEREVEAEAAQAGDEESFDPLEMDRFSRMQELSRALSESVNDLSSIENTLNNLNRENETLLLQQSRVNTDLQDGLMRTRMVPFANLVPRMRRIVRQASQELGKKASLKVLGAEGEMDRTVLERVVPPLEHMLRNAVAHGIEDPAVRARRGKPEGGTISVSLEREGADVVIRVHDDGGGMDLDAIREKAVSRGLVRDSAGLTDKEVMQFVLESGFSTAATVTQIAGRGVGMDVVNAEIKQLGGSLEIDSDAGSGTRFTVRLPFTLALNQAILCQAGDEVYAIPLSTIEGVVRMDRGTLRGYLDNPGEATYEYAGSRYDVRSLATLLGIGEPQLPDDGRRTPLILVQAGDHRLALQVDGLIGSRDIVVKSVGVQVSTVPGIFGATILADGRVVLILDVSSLVRFGVDAVQETGEAAVAEAVDAEDGAEAAAAAQRERPLVMVVDDSITMRKVATRLLERNNMEVVTAKDGVDAVASLQETVPDAMLLDIEMPRMDGYELATHMRNDERLNGVPIVMITSRTGEKHRERALEIGVNRYLGKPYQESDLLGTLQELLEERRVRH